MNWFIPIIIPLGSSSQPAPTWLVAGVSGLVVVSIVCLVAAVVYMIRNW